MSYIIISPFSRKLKDGKKNPKDYPHWKQLVAMLEGAGHTLVQVGVEGEERLVASAENHVKGASLADLAAFLQKCDAWVGVDNAFQHLAWRAGKPGVVLFGQSDPSIFGHPENTNLYRDAKFFRNDQFGLWEGVPYMAEAFVPPATVKAAIDAYLDGARKPKPKAAIPGRKAKGAAAGPVAVAKPEPSTIWD